MTYSDPEFVTRQYSDASNLKARIALHERFSTNPYGLRRWIFDHLDLPDGTAILEVGCGPGVLWTENLDLLPKDWAITLTDASPGMVAEAEARLEPDGRFEFQVADVRVLPFDDGRFDAVVANHMLYHVPEVRPLVEYLLSGSAADTAALEFDADEFDRRVSELTERLEEELTSRGAIHITKDTGLFIARK